VNLQEASQVSFMVDYLGTTIEAEGNTFNLENGQAKFAYSLATKSRETLITIKDEKGHIVYSQNGETDPGKHFFVWDGTDSSGQSLATAPIPSPYPRSTRRVIDRYFLHHFRPGHRGGIGWRRSRSVLGEVAVPMEAVISVNETPEESFRECNRWDFRD